MCFHFYINRLHYLPCKKGNTDAQNVSFWNTLKWPNYLVVINAMCFVEAMECLFSFDFMILKELNNVCAKYRLKNYMGNKERCFSSYHERWTKESPWRTLDFALWCSTTEQQRLYSERGPLWSSHLKCILHTARISNVDSVMFVNRIREMASFELGKEIKKDVLHLVTSVGQGMGDILYYHGFTNQKNIIWNMKLKWEIISTIILVM